jgi:hypothetical protein
MELPTVPPSWDSAKQESKQSYPSLEGVITNLINLEWNMVIIGKYAVTGRREVNTLIN